jgi:uncharacterized protein
MKRTIIEQLLNWKQKPSRKPLILRGTRQVGKSWILKHLGSYFQNFHYINFERDQKFNSIFNDSLNPEEVIRKLELLLNQDINIHNDLVIFDEIQDCPRALTSLKYFCEDMPELALCSAGSHLGINFSSSDAFPTGKIENFNMFPMTFEEYLIEKHPRLIDSYRSYSISGTEHSLLKKAYFDYLFTGGMPEVVKNFSDQLSDINNCRDIQSDLLIAYSSDFAKYASGQNSSHLLAVYKNIPHQLQANIDESVSRFKFKGVIKNRSRYSQFKGPIDWLVHTGIILQCLNVKNNSLPLIAKENIFKLFYHDTGLLQASLNLSYMDISGNQYGSYKGFIAENFVAQELTAQNISLKTWQVNDSSSKSELEFLLNHRGLVIPVEAKSSTKTQKAKSLLAYKKKYSPQVSVKFSGLNLRFEKDQINAPIYLSGRIVDLVDHFLGE